MTTKITFTTLPEVIDYVETALGEFASDYDVDAIAREISDWQGGKLVLTIDDPDDSFWEIAEKYDMTDGEVK